MCRALKQRTYFNRVHGTLGQLISYLLSYSAYRRRHQIISYSDINMVCVLLCHAIFVHAWKNFSYIMPHESLHIQHRNTVIELLSRDYS